MRLSNGHPRSYQRGPHDDVVLHVSAKNLGKKDSPDLFRTSPNSRPLIPETGSVPIPSPKP